MAEKQLSGSDNFYVATVLCSVAAGAFIGGWISARLARKATLLNGTLSASAMILFSIADSVFGPFSSGSTVHISPIVDAIISYSGPIYSFAGASVAASVAIANGSVKKEKLGLGEIAIVAFRWLCTVPTATIAYFGILLSLIRLPASSTAFVFAAAIGLVAGVSVAPPRHRRCAYALLAGLIIFTPIMKLVIDAAINGAVHIDELEITFNVVGCAFAYPILQTAFPESFRLVGRWWWLSTRDYRRFSAIERQVRTSVWTIAAFTTITLFAFFISLGNLLALDDHFTAAFGGLASMAVGLLIARPMASAMWPDKVRKADESAGLRLAADR